jgi:hypothetical protein
LARYLRAALVQAGRVADCLPPPEPGLIHLVLSGHEPFCRCTDATSLEHALENANVLSGPVVILGRRGGLFGAWVVVLR